MSMVSPGDLVEDPDDPLLFLPSRSVRETSYLLYEAVPFSVGLETYLPSPRADAFGRLDATVLWGAASASRTFRFHDSSTWRVEHELQVLRPGTVDVTGYATQQVAQVRYVSRRCLVVSWPEPTSGRVVVSR